MPKPYSQDLRMRVVEAVEGGASRREVAELYGISPSVVVIWMQRWSDTGKIEAKPSGGSVSPLDEHVHFLLGLIAEQPDNFPAADAEVDTVERLHTTIKFIDALHPDQMFVHRSGSCLVPALEPRMERHHAENDGADEDIIG